MKKIVCLAHPCVLRMAMESSLRKKRRVVAERLSFYALKM